MTINLLKNKHLKLGIKNMKLNLKLGIVAVVGIMLSGVTQSANAGQSSHPLMSSLDLDLEGNPMEVHCPDGWVFAGSTEFCKPVGGKDYMPTSTTEVPTNTNTNTNSNTNNVKSNSTSTANSKNVNDNSYTNFNVENDNKTTFFNGSSLANSSFNIVGTTDFDNDVNLGLSLSVPLGTNKNKVLEGLKISEFNLLADSCSKLAMVNLTSPECSQFTQLVDYSSYEDDFYYEEAILPAPPVIDVPQLPQLPQLPEVEVIIPGGY